MAEKSHISKHNKCHVPASHQSRDQKPLTREPFNSKEEESTKKKTLKN